jgi:ferrous iron transport protein B
VQRPVNFAGTSVERMESSIEVDGARLRAVDLPGITSLSAVSRDEGVAIDFLKEPGAEGPDVVCAVLDAVKLSIELHLLRQLSGLQRPMVVALNKQDVARRQGRPVNARALEAALGVPVIETDGHTGAGAERLRDAVIARARDGSTGLPDFDPDALVARVQSQGVGRRSWTNRLDAIFLHRIFGLPILAVVIFGTFQLVFTGAEPFIALIEAIQEWLGDLVVGLLAPGALRSFVVDGLINGMGSVVVFLPQIVLLIAFVTILEATGYMARAAFLLDRVLSRIGLSGRSFVPLTSSFACAIPGILASRIIDNERDRIATIVVAPLMSCSARLPVYVVLIGAFFPVAWAGLVLFGLYLLGIAIAALVAFILRRTVLRGGESMLLMELPVYHRPAWRVIANQVWITTREFLILAGTVIFATSIVIWVLSYYPRPAEIHERFEAQRSAVVAEGLASELVSEQLESIDRSERTAYFEQSLLARFGKTIQPVFAPAGFDWRTTVGILAAFPARELIIPSMGILYSLGEVDAGDYDLPSLASSQPVEPEGLRKKLRNATGPDGRPAFTPLIALALMVFFALCGQCVATLGTIAREAHSWRWAAFTFVYMTVLAWVGAVAVYQLGTLMGFGGA